MVLSSIKIENLAKHPEWIKVISQRYFDEWNHLEKEGREMNTLMYRIEHSLKKNALPQMFVAVQNGKPIGMVSLMLTDLSTRPDISPWLAYLYVLPAYRKFGVGTMLQEYTLKMAKKLHYTSMYLCTLLDGYYERTGWHFVELAPYINGDLLRLYKHTL